METKKVISQEVIKKVENICEKVFGVEAKYFKIEKKIKKFKIVNLKNYSEFLIEFNNFRFDLILDCNKNLNFNLYLDKISFLNYIFENKYNFDENTYFIVFYHNKIYDKNHNENIIYNGNLNECLLFIYNKKYEKYINKNDDDDDEYFVIISDNMMFKKIVYNGEIF